MKQQLYVGSVAVNHSVEGPIPDPVALPAGGSTLKAAKGIHLFGACPLQDGGCLSLQKACGSAFLQS